jgi:hypothetical protein
MRFCIYILVLEKYSYDDTSIVPSFIKSLLSIFLFSCFSYREN